MKLYLTDMGIACFLGKNKEEVSKNLFSPTRLQFSQTKTLFSGKEVPVGSLQFELPELPKGFQRLNSLNNRFLKHILDEISSTIDLMKQTYDTKRIGIIMATSASGMAEGEKAFEDKIKTGKWPHSYDYQQQEAASPSLFVAQYLGVEGPAYTISTACSSGSKALFSAKRLIEADICDVVICGGADTLCNLTLNGFDSLDLVSQTPCRPLDKNRDGITIGEGGAVFVLSKEKGTHDIALLGTGESSDAYHISTPDPNGTGAEQAICDALEDASLTPRDISYINLHGTGTLLNDSMECNCINRIFGDKTPCSSTKALTGHTLGACGSIEAAFLWIALASLKNREFPLPPHHGVQTIDSDLAKIHLVNPNEKVEIQNKFVALMSNSFAFGGSNASLILGKNIPLKEEQ